MNSIETYQPPKVTSRESEESSSEEQFTDAAALGNLRALMGGLLPQQQSSFQSGLGSSTEEPANLLALLENLLAEDLPPSLAALVNGLKDHAQGGGDVTSDPAAADQVKALLQGLTAVSANENSQAREALMKALNQEPSTIPGAAPRPDVAAFPEAPPETANLGQAILQSLGNQSAAAASAASVVSTPMTADRIDHVSSLMSQMADRVLVTDPLHGQTQEVRIKLAENIMPGTEVRMWREDGGQLRVEFDTVSPYWARALNEASPLLSQRLNERLSLGENVQVTVNHQGQQPEDGRSRNRYTPWELAQQMNEQ